MIDYLYYTNGKYVLQNGISYLNYLKSISSKNNFLCMFLQNPTESEVAGVCKNFSVDQKYFQKFKTEKRSLRYSFEPLIFAFTDYYIDKTIKTSHMLFILKNNILIMVIYDKSKYYEDMFDKIIQNAQKKKITRIGYILYEFLHEDAKENYDVLEMMDERLYQMEQKVIASSGHDDKMLMKELLVEKRELIRMGKRLWASSKIIFTIKKDLADVDFTRDELLLLDDIYDTLVHQIDMIDTHKEMVSDILNIFTTIISNRLSIISNDLNMVMKKMAALTIIIMIPTFIAGVYGTNFHFLPEITWQYGYLYMWGAMIIAAGLAYYFFHKKNWV